MDCSTFRISGRVIDRAARRGIPSLQVEAWDKITPSTTLSPVPSRDERRTFEMVFEEFSEDKSEGGEP